MLKRIKELQNPLTIALNNVGRSQLLFSPNEWILIDQLIKVLASFDGVTTMASYERNVSLSFVAPMFWNLKNIHLSANADDLPVIQNLKKVLGISLQDRFKGILKSGSSTMLATLLDPR
jgi:hypothetical protein